MKRKSPSANSNWVKDEVLTLIRKNANQALTECKKEENKQHEI
jgi:prophage antirepressor-like protein